MPSDDRKESPWYCPDCAHWVGSKRTTCDCGRSEPRRPLRWDDVQKPSFEVTLRDRLKAKLGWFA